MLHLRGGGMVIEAAADAQYGPAAVILSLATGLKAQLDGRVGRIDGV